MANRTNLPRIVTPFPAIGLGSGFDHLPGGPTEGAGVSKPCSPATTPGSSRGTPDYSHSTVRTVR